MNGNVSFFVCESFFKVSWLLHKGAQTYPFILHIERLQHIRGLQLRSDLIQLIHQNRLLQLAREGVATTAQHLARFDDPRRYGTLVAECHRSLEDAEEYYQYRCRLAEQRRI